MLALFASLVKPCTEIFLSYICSFVSLRRHWKVHSYKAVIVLHTSECKTFFINDAWFHNNLFDIMYLGLGVSCRIICASIQTSFKQKFRQGDDSCKKKRKEEKSCT